MSEQKQRALKLDQAASSTSRLVATKVIDCMIQFLMNKELLPPEVNDIYRTPDILIAQNSPVDEHDGLVWQLARADLAGRLGEAYVGEKADPDP